MDITIEIENLQELMRKLKAAPGKIDTRLSAAVSDSVNNIKEYASEHHKFESRTGKLERSIQAEANKMTGRVFLNENIAEYGKFVHEGIKHPFTVKPRFKKSLRFVEGSDVIFSKEVTIPARDPDEFIYDAAKNRRKEIDNIFNREINNVIMEVTG